MGSLSCQSRFPFCFSAQHIAGLVRPFSTSVCAAIVWVFYPQAGRQCGPPTEQLPVFAVHLSLRRYERYEPPWLCSRLSELIAFHQRKMATRQSDRCLLLTEDCTAGSTADKGTSTCLLLLHERKPKTILGVTKGLLDSTIKWSVLPYQGSIRQ